MHGIFGLNDLPNYSYCWRSAGCVCFGAGEEVLEVHVCQWLAFSWFAVKAILSHTVKDREGATWDINACIIEILVSWLQKEDKVTETGVSCLAVLKLPLVNIGEPQLASETPVSCCVCIHACMFTMHAFTYHWSNFYSSPGTCTK